MFELEQSSNHTKSEFTKGAFDGAEDFDHSERRF